MSNGFTERQCPHNRCLNHNPNFGNQKEEKSDFTPSMLFKMATYKKDFYCCKKKMKAELINLLKICEHCGRKKLWPDGYGFLCECCGFHIRTDVNWVRDRENDIKLRFWLAPLVVSLIAFFESVIQTSFGEASNLVIIIVFTSITIAVVSALKAIRSI